MKVRLDYKKLAAVVLAVSLNASAATNIPPVQVTIEVVGSRIEDSSATLPAHVEVFDGEGISASGAWDLSEFLGRKANLHLRTLNANPLQTQISMRGFGENSFGRVKVVLDGEELNTADMNAPDLQRVNLEGVSTIEIIHGASPILYGDGAEAGVIRVTSEPGDYRTKTRLTAKVGAYGAAGVGAETHGGLSEEGLRYSAGYRYERADGCRDRSGFDLHNFDASLRREFGNDAFLGFRANYSNALYEMPGALDWEEWKDDPRQAKYDNDWCRTWNYAFAVNTGFALADERTLTVDAVFSVKHRTSHWGDYGYQNDYDLYGWQFSPRYVDARAVGGFDNKLTLGFDARHEYYEVNDRSGFGTPEYSFTRTRGGVFGLDEFSLLDSLTFVAGARFEGIDNRWSHYRGLNQSHSTDWIGDYELGLTYRPWSWSKFYLKGTRFHRSAFCDELNYTESGEFLRPERGTSLDLGVEMEIAEEFRLDASGYWSWIDDEIFYNPHAHDFGGGIWGGFNCNSPGRVERRGFDLGFQWQRERVAEAALRSSLVDARYTSGEYSGKSVPAVPKVRVRAEVGWWPLDELEIKAGACFVSSQTLAGDFGGEADQLADYTLFDLSLVYTPSWAEGWKFWLGVDNLFDRAYCDFAGYSDAVGAYFYPARGRSFSVVVSYTW